MYVCKCWLDLLLVERPGSLKGKRQVTRRLRDRLVNRFPVSVAEVGSNNLHHRAEIGIALVTSSRDRAHAIIEKLMACVENEHPVEILDRFVEIEKLK